MEAPLSSAPPLSEERRSGGAGLKWAVLFVAAGLVFAIDQISKAWVVANVPFGTSITPVPGLANYFKITYSANRGAAFSFLPEAANIFLIIALIMLVAIPYFYRRLPPGHWVERIALGMLLGGVAGNALDRIRLGYVVDFVHLQLQPIISNVSNLADHAIVVSILILFIAQSLEKRPQEKTPAAPGIGEGANTLAPLSPQPPFPHASGGKGGDPVNNPLRKD